MNASAVSVVVAVKNGEKYIKTALESVAAQTFAPPEIIVVDGNSTDGTLAVVEKFSKVRVIKQTGNGIPNAYNTGIMAASGEFIAFLSSDDIWLPAKIELQVAALQHQPTAAFAVCLVKFFLDNPNFTPPGFRRELLTGAHPAFIMETLCARRAAFDNVGFFDENLTTAEDVDWFARAADLGIESVVVPQVLLRKRIHAANAHLNSAENNRNLLQAIKNSLERKQNLSAFTRSKIG